ncbi:MAG: TraB family protein [Myxococcota bacterium]|jgi:pheromone shutdown-related protein TraB|nr:conjugal transfer protein TraB [Deltaproteobacteria bacterium]MCP4239864.1 TraB family protein [bacterium]MDP6074418.1 TraB family protein [Myxococcota bacterium]MDP6244188.1 TraB family protein [Myxococcota bacterium]MDP7073803.1 TraB family protein [Myxococcota bacterium]
MESPADGTDWSRDVHSVAVGDREIILVGTAHISRESADLVREVIEHERPDAVCIELDPQRFAALSQKRRFDALDLKQVIRNRQLAALIANLLLATYQKKLGGKLGVTPGTELLEASRTAERLEIPISLCDRDVRVTLRRAWSALSLWKKARLVSDFLASGFESAELDEDQLRQMRERDVLSELMEDLGRALPELKQVLIDERDAYLAHRIRETEGQRVVAVVGAGHVEGMRRALEEQREIDLHALETVPPVSTVWRWVGWGVPTLVIGGLVWIGLTKGASVAGESLAFWILANGVPSTIAAAAALAHPATVAAAFFVAPVTSLTPVIGAGTVLAFVQSWVQPPLVSEFESFSDDMASPRAWWRSRLLRVLLVFVLTTIGSLIGTYVGGLEILANVF